LKIKQLWWLNYKWCKRTWI